MKTKLLLLTILLYSFSIHAQIDFEAHVIAESHPSLSGPYNLVSADLDGDGDKDIVATSTNGNNIVWFENLDGNGNFSEPRIIVSNMEYPLDIAVADIDGDGDLDIVAVSTNDHKIVWFKNLDGQGNFGQQQLVAQLNEVQTVQAKDMDGDGDIDIIAGGDYKVIWLENTDGQGTFGPERIIANDIQTTESIEVGDVDGDGDMDVVVADWLNQTISWYENLDGMGTFGPSRLITAEGDATSSVILKDFDNDGILDVAADYQIGSIAWFKNEDGQGNFGDANVIGSGMGTIYKLYSEDINGNGNNDILASDWNQDKILLFENYGNGNFGNSQIIHSESQNPIGIIADDFNGDGKMDVAACFRGPDKLMWFENKGVLGVEAINLNNVNIYPNPTDDFLYISSNSPVSEILLVNSLGQIIMTERSTNQINISQLSKGLYLAHIITADGVSSIEKIIKK